MKKELLVSREKKSLSVCIRLRKSELDWIRNNKLSVTRIFEAALEELRNGE